MKYYEVEEDPDTLAVLYRGDLEVRFITADYDVDDEVKAEMVRELAVKHLADSLDKILEELILERDIGAIEDVSFETGIKEILDDY